MLARKSNGFSVDIEYVVVKDYCMEKDYDFLETYKILRHINNRVISN